MNRTLGLFTVVLAIAFTSRIVEAQVVGRLLEVNGSLLIRAADGVERAGTVYGAVSKGDRIRVGNDSTIVLGWHETGELQRITGNGEAVVGERALEAGPGLTVALITPPKQAIVAMGVKALGGLPSGALTVARGVKDKPLRPSIAPISGSTVLTVEPSFSWPAAKDAVHYRLRLNTSEGQLWEKQPKETRLTYPSPKPLERGLQYQWVVTAALPNQAEHTVAEGEFTVAVESEAREANELQSLVGAQDEFLLSLIALRLEQQDLIAEAITVYEKLAKLSAKTPAYHAALSELYDKAGRTKDAEESRNRAVKLGFKFD